MRNSLDGAEDGLQTHISRAPTPQRVSPAELHARLAEFQRLAQLASRLRDTSRIERAQAGPLRLETKRIIHESKRLADQSARIADEIGIVRETRGMSAEITGAITGPPFRPVALSA